LGSTGALIAEELGADNCTFDVPVCDKLETIVVEEEESARRLRGLQTEEETTGDSGVQDFIDQVDVLGQFVVSKVTEMMQGVPLTTFDPNNFSLSFTPPSVGDDAEDNVCQRLMGQQGLGPQELSSLVKQARSFSAKGAISFIPKIPMSDCKLVVGMRAGLFTARLSSDMAPFDAQVGLKQSRANVKGLKRASKKMVDDFSHARCKHLAIRDLLEGTDNVSPLRERMAGLFGDVEGRSSSFKAYLKPLLELKESIPSKAEVVARDRVLLGFFQETPRVAELKAFARKRVGVLKKVIEIEKVVQDAFFKSVSTESALFALREEEEGSEVSTVEDSHFEIVANLKDTLFEIHGNFLACEGADVESGSDENKYLAALKNAATNVQDRLPSVVSDALSGVADEVAEDLAQVEEAAEIAKQLFKTVAINFKSFDKVVASAPFTTKLDISIRDKSFEEHRTQISLDQTSLSLFNGGNGADNLLDNIASLKGMELASSLQDVGVMAAKFLGSIASEVGIAVNMGGLADLSIQLIGRGDDMITSESALRICTGDENENDDVSFIGIKRCIQVAGGLIASALPKQETQPPVDEVNE
jgi:hypothetical protein